MPEIPDDFDEQEDARFDAIYPPAIHALSAQHWTPVSVARRAAAYLVPQAGTRVLDIGCGPAKFCIVGALATNGHFTGIEQRESLVAAARDAVAKTNARNVEILHGNVIGIEFSGFDAFYFFNPFGENLLVRDRIDSSVVLSKSMHRKYTEHVTRQLAATPVGTRIACYWTAFDGEALGFQLQASEPFDMLKFWEKRKLVARRP